MTQTPEPIEGHRVARLEQIPSSDPMTRYPTHGQWVCQCGQTGRVRARRGRHTDATMAAHRKHRAEALEADLQTLHDAALPEDAPGAWIRGAIQALMLEGGRAMLDGRPCRFHPHRPAAGGPRATRQHRRAVPRAA